VMRLIICAFHQILLGQEIKDDGIRRECSTHVEMIDEYKIYLENLI
jgi:hypothetical protein